MGHVEQIVRVIKKLFQFWKRHQEEQQQQQQQQQQQSQPSQYKPPEPPHQYQSPYPPPPKQAWNHPEDTPPPKDSYKPGKANGTGQQPFQGHKTHVGQYHDASPQSIATSSSYYTSLRNEAIHEGHLMGKCFDEAHVAYESGDGARAKALSNEGRMHQSRRDEINGRAADWIFHENNKNSPSGTTDLHGLFVQEALHYTELAVKEGKEKGFKEIQLIVGKGIHSANHQQKIKPAVMELMEKEHLRPYPDPENAGVLIVQLNSNETPRDFSWARGLDIDGRVSSSRGMEKDDISDCVIS